MWLRFHHLFFLHPRLYGCACRWYGIWPEFQAGPWCRFQLETCKHPCFRRETTSFSLSLVSLMSTCNSFMWMKMSACMKYFHDRHIVSSSEVLKSVLVDCVNTECPLHCQNPRTCQAVTTVERSCPCKWMATAKTNWFRGYFFFFF